MKALRLPNVRLPALHRAPANAAVLRPLALGALLLWPAASAAPRVGEHDGYTRLVFDLPTASGVKILSQTSAARRLTVKLSSKLSAEQGALEAKGVTAYAVSGGTVIVTLASGVTGAKASVLGATAGQAARLVIDVPNAEKTASAARPAQTPAPTPSVVRTASTRTPTRPRVVLDAGHGGVDPGMASRWIVEEDVTLDIALRTRAELVKHGVDVVMVRDRDTQLSTDKTRDLDERARLAKNDAVSAYISIHVNAGSAAAQGIETYYFGQPLAGRNRSLAIQENGGGALGETLTRRATSSAQDTLGDILAQAKLSFSRALAQKVQSRLIAATGAVNRGVQTDAFYVIRNPTTAAILVEVGFGSSPVEGPKLATAAYRERLAQGLARAILDFLNVK
ncbi:N-acetylmuramoyl-L-alanine amidase [Deinococcus taklimakanensis]|uniref:N-acetylmuramoyl-L-alanine amidase n=1 Tax=Deinococcus taklimakanensis TaxID=536443 RepID=A0ABW5P4A6_9DEIO